MSTRAVNDSTSEAIRKGVTRTLLGLGVLVVLYVLTAPPVIKTVTKRTGSLWWPRFYAPMTWGLENNVTHPVFTWYFNDVWGCDIQFL